ncbi:PIN domain-containing protein [Streptomyces sp. NBC_01716]|uniref:PIN domain-containing protein n=1 Tax=Streptomyces sp. NBC_01716 TaxID=2975917 RepID=UPI002E3255DB|nr:PIN domain-containing protein [Streptomyces sp. NBC_01716]
MIRYLIDSSAVWRILRDKELRAPWSEAISGGAVGSCHPQRVEFKRSARHVDEYDRMTDMFAELHPDVSVPKNPWPWIEAAQYRLAQRGRHQALSVTDWLICATAAHRDVVVLHDDNDFKSAASLLPDLRERRIHEIPH